jgi:hypothetical protein
VRSLSLGAKLLGVAVIGVAAVAFFSIASAIFHFVEIGVLVVAAVAVVRVTRRGARAIGRGRRHQLR